MKSNLSQILPVAEACAILGEDCVRRVVRSFLYFRTPNRPPTNEDIRTLVNALMYDPGENDVPQNILTTWNRLTRRTSGLDKAAFIRFMIPASAAPFNGPGGHMGLYDCWVNALSVSANGYNNNAGTPVNPVVLLPDILVVVAVCREYREVQNMDRADSLLENMASRQDYAIMMLSVLAFRVYDSYQKKGTVTRDTVHRFLSDVHGEDSYKTTPVRRTLDILFTAPEIADMDDPMAPSKPRVLSHLTPGQFANAIRKTLGGKVSKHHILLDWISTLGNAMVPLHELPGSTQAYLDTLGSTHRSIETVCQEYGLASLYEIKRRFHSLVETNQVVQGDIMKEASEDDKAPTRPRHVISKQAFVEAVSKSNSDMGHGGYLSPTLAELVFRQGACPVEVADSPDGQGSCFWALYDVLHFSSVAVRQKPSKHRGDISAELPLIRFAFRVFCSYGSSADRNNRRRALDRWQIGQMLLMLIEQNMFRHEADSPLDDDDTPHPSYVTHAEDDEKVLVDVDAASLLALLPSKPGKAVKNNQVPLGLLIDHVLDQGAMEDDNLTFDGLCKWYYRSDNSDLPLSQRRLGPFLTELRLISAILFGVPPTRASMERHLVAELQRRHKYRYPQTDSARRGPRGTVWYILDDRWFRKWSSLVQRVDGSTADFDDGREVIGGSPRGLGKINNTSLLSDNGTLALRAEIRWRQDYEIVPPLVWSAFQAWYDGGPPIHRTVVRYIPSSGAPSVHSRSPRVRTEYEIELYPFFVTIFLCDAASRGDARPFQQYTPVSRVSPVRALLIQLCKGLSVDPKYGRLWMMEGNPDDGEGDDVDWLLNLDQSILDQRNRRGGAVDTRTMTLLLELKDEESGKWPRGLDGRTWTMTERRTPDRDNAETGNGVVGLYNMGCV